MKTKKLLAVLLAAMLAAGSISVPAFADEVLADENAVVSDSAEVETVEEGIALSSADMQTDGSNDSTGSQESASTVVAKIGDVEYTSLAKAVTNNDAADKAITLIDNVTLTETLTITNSTTIDLAGFDITSTAVENANATITTLIAVTNGATLTVKGGGTIEPGTRTNIDNYSKDFYTISAEENAAIIIDGVTVKGSKGINTKCGGTAVKASNASVTIQNAAKIYGGDNKRQGITSSNYTTYKYTHNGEAGTAVDLGSNAVLSVTDSYIYGGDGLADNNTDKQYISGGSNFAISGAGISTWGAKSVYVSNSTVAGGKSTLYNAENAIYVGNDTALTVKGSTVTGGSCENAGNSNYGIAGHGIEVNMGKSVVVITDSTVTGGNSAGSWIGSGISVPFNGDAELNIEHSTIVAGSGDGSIDSTDAAFAIAAGKNISVELKDVTLKANEKKETALSSIIGSVTVEGFLTVEGGTLNTKIAVKEGSYLKDDGNGTYIVENIKEKFDNDNITNEEKVETINSVVISTDNTQVTEKVVETIKTLPVEKKEEIAPAKVEEIIATKTESDVKTATAATTASEDEDTVAVTAKLTSIDSSLTLNVQPKTTDSSIQLPAGTKAARFEVKVEKTTDDTTETVTETEVPMLLTFELADGVSAKSVIRIHDGKQESVPFTQDGTTVKVTAAKFSEYAVVLPADTPAAGGAVLTFEDDIDGDGICNIYLVGDENATVTNFESGEFAIANNASSGKVGMVLEGAKDTDGNALLTIDEVSEGCYKIHRPNGTVAYPEADGTNHKILLGTIALSGTGNGQIYAEHIKMYRKSTDNENLAVEIPTTSDYVNYDIKAETAKLTVNVTFPNAVENQKTAYQDMKITISGGDLAEDIVYNLGSNASENVAWNAENAVYTLTVADKLTKNVAYTVKVEGAGYRTARYTVNMTDAKTLNFWNNVKDSAIEVVEGDGMSKKTTFLAGDIVKDNQINIYDLSAVVSYFGTDNLVDDHPEYAKYDLNRDGKIDSKDIAYVLVSWGK